MPTPNTHLVNQLKTQSYY